MTASSSHRIRLAEKPFLRSDLPKIAVGDTVDVDVKVKEGDKERVQTFSGTVIAIRGGGTGETFTVRKIVQGEGVERIFPLHSPVIDALRITRKGRVRRAKLYYLRKRVGKATRLTQIMGEEGQEAVAQASPAAAAKPAKAETSEGESAKAETPASRK